MSEPLVPPPPPPPPRSWVGAGQPPQAPASVSQRPATSHDPRKSLYLSIGLMVAVGAGVAAYKYNEKQALQREFDAQAREAAPLRMPAMPVEPPKELAGILPDASERQAALQPPATPSELPNAVVQAPPASDATLSKDLALLASGPKGQPELKPLTDLLDQNPGIKAASRRFQKDHDMNALMRAMQADPAFSQKLVQTMSDPKFQEQLARLKSQQDGSHVPPVNPAEEAGPVMDPSALQDGEGSGGDTINPADISGSGPEAKTPSSAPPAPRGRP